MKTEQRLGVKLSAHSFSKHQLHFRVAIKNKHVIIHIKDKICQICISRGM